MTSALQSQRKAISAPCFFRSAYLLEVTVRALLSELERIPSRYDSSLVTRLALSPEGWSLREHVYQ